MSSTLYVGEISAREPERPGRAWGGPRGIPAEIIAAAIGLPAPTPDQRAVIEAPPATQEEKADLQKRLAYVEDQIRDYKRRKAGGAGAAPSKTSDFAQQIVDQETEWARLNRDVAEAGERYRTLESRVFQATMAASSEESARCARLGTTTAAARHRTSRVAGR